MEENLSKLRQEVCQKSGSNKKKIVLLWAVYAALYFNFGWITANYYTYKLPTIYKENPTLVAKIAAGGWGILALDAPMKEGEVGTEVSSALRVLLWPLVVVLSFISWFLYGLGGGLYWLLWVMFWGGGVKLLGLI